MNREEKVREVMFRLEYDPDFIKTPETTLMQITLETVLTDSEPEALRVADVDALRRGEALPSPVRLLLNGRDEVWVVYYEAGDIGVPVVSRVPRDAGASIRYEVGKKPRVVFESDLFTLAYTWPTVKAFLDENGWIKETFEGLVTSQ